MNEHEQKFISYWLDRINHLTEVGYTDDQMREILEKVYSAGKRIGHNLALDEIFTGGPDEVEDFID